MATFPSFYGCIIFHCMYVCSILYSFVCHGHLGSFHNLATVNIPAVNMKVNPGFVKVPFWFSPDKIKSRMLSSLSQKPASPPLCLRGLPLPPPGFCPVLSQRCALSSILQHPYWPLDQRIWLGPNMGFSGKNPFKSITVLCLFSFLKLMHAQPEASMLHILCSLSPFMTKDHMPLD